MVVYYNVAGRKVGAHVVCVPQLAVDSAESRASILFLALMDLLELTLVFSLIALHGHPRCSLWWLLARSSWRRQEAADTSDQRVVER